MTSNAQPSDSLRVAPSIVEGQLPNRRAFGHQVGSYHEFAPPPDPADAVEGLWTHESVAGVQVTVHRVVPDAAVSLCFMVLPALPR